MNDQVLCDVIEVCACMCVRSRSFVRALVRSCDVIEVRACMCARSCEFRAFVCSGEVIEDLQYLKGPAK